MNLKHLSDTQLIALVVRQANGWYRPGSPFWKAANHARELLADREYVVDEPQKTTPDITETDTFPAVRDTD